ncbi:MAG: copper chaperone PCu(A)C [Gammaproteobacteria bacterium]|nr:copper chaperone PCu(A)C [Gammaproteobacteria bacterium]
MKTHSHFKIFKFFSSLLLLVVFSANSFAANITIIEPYARAVPGSQPNSAAFMILKNNGTNDRALVNARSSVSKVVELHTHKKEGGMMRMRRVKQIAIKADSEAVLKPGGLHIMFIGLKQQLNPGDNVDLELMFDDGSQQQLSVPVKMVAGMKHKKPIH